MMASPTTAISLPIKISDPVKGDMQIGFQPASVYQNGNTELTYQIIGEFLNLEYGSHSRRRASIIRQPYQTILEPHALSSYPMNCIGTYARLTPAGLEGFVNIAKLAALLRSQQPEGILQGSLLAAETDDEAFSQLRDSICSAMHAIGDYSYYCEWCDDVTYDNIDTLLENLASYRKNNETVADQLRDHISKIFSHGKVVTVLDLGSGLGGT
ncbi:MAG: hypothetical protein HY540_02065, partial [Deltaproteobacteria bacterium]|nr:hypothetical protein [Deltaproteobacteria bacterium]